MDKASEFDILKAALSDMLDILSRGRFELLFPTRAATPTARLLRGVHESFYKLQQHDFPEVICCASGELALCDGGGWRRVRPGRVYCLMPGLWHTERALGADRPYRLLWLTAMSAIAGAHVTAYISGRGYYVLNQRTALRTSQADLLAELAGQPRNEFGRVERARLQARLLDVTCELLCNMDNTSDAACTYHEELMHQLKRYLDRHFGEQVPTAELAETFHYSPSHLNVLFRRHAGISLHRYLLGKRMAAARRLLSQTEMEVKQVALEVGYSDPLYFSRAFRKRFGVCPSEFARSARRT